MRALGIGESARVMFDVCGQKTVVATPAIERRAVRSERREARGIERRPDRAGERRNIGGRERGEAYESGGPIPCASERCS